MHFQVEVKLNRNTKRMALILKLMFHSNILDSSSTMTLNWLRFRLNMVQGKWAPVKYKKG